MLQLTIFIIFVTTACGERLNNPQLLGNALDGTDDERKGGFVQHDIRGTFGGVWTDWKEGMCSMTCGLGTIVRTRNCTTPNPQSQEEMCVGSDREVDLCQQPACPVVGVWTTWTESPCSVTCELGTLIRTRNCSAAHPESENNLCIGSDREVLLCREADCPVDGGWAPWEDTCIQTNWCRGIQKRTRNCTDPKPSGDGSPCQGSDHDISSCDKFVSKEQDCVGSNKVWLSNTQLCVYISTDTKYQMAAVAACEEMCGRLIQIRNSSMLGDLHGRLPRYYYFIDGSDEGMEGSWYFSDGSPLWTNWESGQPGPSNTVNCLIIRSQTYQYQGNYCARNSQYNYVCEILRG